VEGDAVQSLQAEVELVEEQLGFLVQGTDEGVALVKPQQDVQRPLQLREPDVEARHVEEADDKARELLEVFLAAELGVEQHDQVAGVGLGWPRPHHGFYHPPHARLHSTKARDHLLL